MITQKSHKKNYKIVITLTSGSQITLEGDLAKQFSDKLNNDDYDEFIEVVEIKDDNSVTKHHYSLRCICSIEEVITNGEEYVPVTCDETCPPKPVTKEKAE